MYKVYANSLRPTIVETWEEAITLRKMVRAASKSNVEPCHIEKIPDSK